MYSVLNSYKDENGSYLYAVCNFAGGQGVEVITEEELKLLVTMSLELRDSKQNIVTLDGDKLILDVEDITDQLNEYSEESEEEDDDFYSLYDDVEDDEDEDSSDEVSEDEDDYIDLDDYDVAEESEEEDDYEDYEAYDAADYEIRDEMDEYYYAYLEANGGRLPDIGNVTLLPKHEKQHGVKPKTIDGDEEDSVTSKLYSYLTEEQIKMLQEYYLYMGKRIFNLERGINVLPVKRREDLDAVRNTGDSWAYAGFVDMGYQGTSICPVCAKPLGNYGVSECHQAPILVKSKYKVAGTGTKGVPAEYKEYISRTYNGTCSHPQCHKRCSVVTDSVGMRELDRSNQRGVICSNCGTLVPQSSHYCTFNDPVRYMHIAWDITASDLETGFYGQFAIERIENIINSNNCIKFGLSCTAEFFDIAKDSDAFLALKNVQNICIKDMKEMEDIYSSGNTTQDFSLLDSMIDKLVLISTKHLLLKKEEYLPTQMLSLFRDMRKSGMVIPRSLVQFIRDFLVDWDGHKFRENEGELWGSSHNNFFRSYDRVTLVLSELLGKKYITGWEYFRDSLSKYGSNNRYVDSIFQYISLYFACELCGVYKYDALKYTDEGGRAQDEHGAHAKNLYNKYYTASQWLDVKGYQLEFNLENLKSALISLNIISTLSSLSPIALASFEITKDYSTEKEYRGRTYHAYIKRDLNSRYIYSSTAAKLLDTVLMALESNTELHDAYTKVFKGNDEYCKHRMLVSQIKVYYPDTASNVSEGLLAIAPLIELLNNNLELIKTLVNNSAEDIIEKFNKQEEAEIDKAIADEEEYDRLRAEQEAERQRREEAERLEREAREAREAEKSKVEAPTVEVNEEDIKNIDTSAKVVAFLQSKDLSAYDSKFNFAVKLVRELKKRGKVPTPNQFKYIQPLYEAYTGKSYSGVDKVEIKEKVKLEDRPDIQTASEWVVNNREHARRVANSLNIFYSVDKTLDIISSVHRFKTISEAQMKYAEIAVKLYENKDSV